MSILEKMKDVLADGRSSTAIRKIEELYDEVDNPEQFQKALAEGDLEAAAEAAGMREDKLVAKLDNLREFGEAIGKEHSDTIENIDDEELNREVQAHKDG
jgi:protein-disulfide isomerase